jgi:hypothetical protein
VLSLDPQPLLGATGLAELSDDILLRMAALCGDTTSQGLVQLGLSAGPSPLGDLLAAGMILSSRPGRFLAPDGGGGGGGEGRSISGPLRVLFGQQRISPTFSRKLLIPSDIAGKSIDEVVDQLLQGELSPDQIRMEVFEYKGQFVALNNRGLVALSKAGMQPTNIVVRAPSDREFKRLRQRTLIGNY